MKPNANGRRKPTKKQTWAQTLKGESIGLDRDDERCSVSTDVRPADQHFAGAPGGWGFSMGVYPVSAKPKHKSRCVRR